MRRARRGGGYVLPALCIFVLALASQAPRHSDAAAEPIPEASAGADDLVESERYLRARWNAPRIGPDEVYLIRGFDRIAEGYVAALEAQSPSRGPGSSSGAGDAAPLQTSVKPRGDKGWRTGALEVEHPTLYTGNCLTAVQRGDIALAERYAQFMLERLVVKEGAGFWYFNADYATEAAYDLRAPWCSGLSQGMGLVALAALHRATGKTEYAKAAEAVFLSFTVPVEQGGFARYDGEEWWPEEYPTPELSGVLNGGVVALLALHDYWLIEGDQRAKALFDEGTRGFERLVARYETVTSDFADVVSTYSLVERQPMMTLRITAVGDCYVSRAALREDGKIISEVMVGSAEDDNHAASAYVWVNPDYHMWGGRQQHSGRPCRNAYGYPQAIRQFASISMRCPPSPQEPAVYTLEVEYQNPGAQPAELLAYSGTSWHAISKLTPAADEWQLASGTLSDGFVRQAFLEARPEVPVDSHYLDDNSTLVLALADVSGSEILRLYALRWLSGTTDVPYEWRNTNRSDLLIDASREPIPLVTPDRDAVADVGYPSAAYLGDGRLVMWYASRATDNDRWQILSATSEDGGNTWRHLGGVFPEEVRPEWMRGSIGYPFVLHDPEASDPRSRFRMYFSAESGPQAGYSALGFSCSTDGQTWSDPQLVMAGEVLDPSVVQDSTGVYHLYYTCTKPPYASESVSALCHAASPDGKQWSRPVVIRHGQQRSAAERVYSSEAFRFGPYILVLYGHELSPEVHGGDLMFSRDGRDFCDALANPLSISPTIDAQKWDYRRYGWAVLAGSYRDDGSFQIFYTGTDRAEKRTQIGTALIAPTRLRSAIDETLGLLAPTSRTDF